MSNNSIIEHRGSYYFVELREEYLLICQHCRCEKPRQTKCKASPYCKAFILAILENWTNHKRGQGKSLAVAMTHQQWADAMYGMFGRNVIIDSLEELIGEDLVSREAFQTGKGGRDQYRYLLNHREVNSRIRALAERSPTQLEPVPAARFTNKPSQEQRLQVNDQGLQVNVARFTSKPSSSSATFTSKPFIESTKKQNIETERERPTVSAKEQPNNARQGISLSPSLSTSHIESSSPQRPEEKQKPEEHHAEQIVSAAAKPEDLPLSEQLTEEQLDFWQRWCAKTKCGNGALNEKAVTYIVALALRVKTTQDLESLYDLAYERVQELAQAQGKRAIPPHLGNLVKCLPDWEQVQARKRQQQERSEVKHVAGTGSARNLTEARLRGEVVQPVYYYAPARPGRTPNPGRTLNRVTDALPALRERLMKKP